ncbi:hypothetical protein L204_105442 [Cryptococcus depauperatus]
MYPNNNYLHSPASLPLSHPPSHTFDPKWRFPSPQANSAHTQPEVYPQQAQWTHQRRNTLQLNPNLSNYQSIEHDMPLLSAVGGPKYDQDLSVFGTGLAKTRKGSLAYNIPIQQPQPQHLVSGLTPLPINRAWTLDFSTQSSRSPLASAPITSAPCSSKSRMQEERIANRPPSYHGRHQEMNGTELAERSYRGIRGRVGGPPKAVLGGPGGKTFDEMMAEKQGKTQTSPQKSTTSPIPSSVPKNDLATTSSGQISNDKMTEDSIEWNGMPVVVRMPYKTYSPPDSPPPLNPPKDLKESAESPPLRRPRREAFPWPESKVRLSPEGTPLPISPIDITYEDLGEALSEVSFPTVDDEGDATWAERKVIVSVPDPESWKSLHQMRLKLEQEKIIALEEDVSAELEIGSEGSIQKGDEESESVDAVEDAIPTEIGNVDVKPKETIPINIDPSVKWNFDPVSPPPFLKQPPPLSTDSSLEKTIQLTTPGKFCADDIQQISSLEYQKQSFLMGEGNIDKRQDASSLVGKSQGRAFGLSAMNSPLVERQSSGLFKQPEDPQRSVDSIFKVSMLRTVDKHPLTPVDFNVNHSRQSSDSQNSNGKYDTRVPKRSKMRAWSDGGDDEFLDGDAVPIEKKNHKVIAEHVYSGNDESPISWGTAGSDIESIMDSKVNDKVGSTSELIALAPGKMSSFASDCYIGSLPTSSEPIVQTSLQLSFDSDKQIPKAKTNDWNDELLPTEEIVFEKRRRSSECNANEIYSLDKTSMSTIRLKSLSPNTLSSQNKGEDELSDPLSVLRLKALATRGKSKSSLGGGYGQAETAIHSTEDKKTTLESRSSIEDSNISVKHMSSHQSEEAPFSKRLRPTAEPWRPTRSVSTTSTLSRYNTPRKTLRPTAATFTPDLYKPSFSKNEDKNWKGMHFETGNNGSTNSEQLRPTVAPFIPSASSFAFCPQATSFTFTAPLSSTYDMESSEAFVAKNDEIQPLSIANEQIEFISRHHSSNISISSSNAEARMRPTAPPFIPGKKNSVTASSSPHHSPAMLSSATLPSLTATKIRATAAAFVPTSVLQHNVFSSPFTFRVTDAEVKKPVLKPNAAPFIPSWDTKDMAIAANENTEPLDTAGKLQNNLQEENKFSLLQDGKKQSPPSTIINQSGSQEMNPKETSPCPLEETTASLAKHVPGGTILPSSSVRILSMPSDILDEDTLKMTAISENFTKLDLQFQKEHKAAMNDEGDLEPIDAYNDNVKVLRREATPLPAADLKNSVTLSTSPEPNQHSLHGNQVLEANRIPRPDKPARHEHHSHRPRVLRDLSCSSNELNIHLKDIVIHPSQPLNSHHTTPMRILGEEGEDMGFPDAPQTASTQMAQDAEIGFQLHTKTDISETPESLEREAVNSIIHSFTSNSYLAEETRSLAEIEKPKNDFNHLQTNIEDASKLIVGSSVNDNFGNASLASDKRPDSWFKEEIRLSRSNAPSPEVEMRSREEAYDELEDYKRFVEWTYPLQDESEASERSAVGNIPAGNHGPGVVSANTALGDDSTYYDAFSEIVPSALNLSRISHARVLSVEAPSLTDSPAAYPRLPSELFEDSPAHLKTRKPKSVLGGSNGSSGSPSPKTRSSSQVHPTELDRQESVSDHSVASRGNGLLKILEILRKQEKKNELVHSKLETLQDDILHNVRQQQQQPSAELLKKITSTLKEHTCLLSSLRESMSESSASSSNYTVAEKDRPQELFAAILTSQHAILSKFDEVASAGLGGTDELHEAIAALHLAEDAANQRSRIVEEQAREMNAMKTKLEENMDQQRELKADVEVLKQRLKDSRRERDELRESLQTKDKWLKEAMTKQNKVSEEIDRLVARTLAAELERDALAKSLDNEREEEKELVRSMAEMRQEMENQAESSRLDLAEKDAFLSQVQSELHETRQALDETKRVAMRTPATPQPPLATASALCELTQAAFTFHEEALSRMGKLDDAMHESMESRVKEYENVLEQNRKLGGEVEGLRTKLEETSAKHHELERDLLPKLSILEADNKTKTEFLAHEIKRREEAEKKVQDMETHMATMQEQIMKWQVELAIRQSQASTNEMRLQTLAQENTYWREFALNADRRRFKSYLASKPFESEQVSATPHKANPARAISLTSSISARKELEMIDKSAKNTKPRTQTPSIVVDGDHESLTDAIDSALTESIGE